MVNNNPFKSGIVAVFGKPNVGKSTLLNAIVGEALAAVSAKPQTTWVNTRGILTREHGQIVFIDTPGIHQATKKMNQAMIVQAFDAVADADVCLMIVDATQLTSVDQTLLLQAKQLAKPLIIAVNKVDLLHKDAVLLALAKLSQWAPVELYPISAKQGTQVELLTEALFALLPEGLPLYPNEELSDRPLRFIVGEYVRQAIFELFEQEVPYSTFVTVEEFLEQHDRVVIRANIHVERQSQKQMIIGQAGQKIKQIGQKARMQAQTLLQKKVYLDLWIKVSPKWTQHAPTLKRLGLLEQNNKQHRLFKDWQNEQ